MNTDVIFKGLLFDKTVNVIAISGTELVEKARELHGLSRVATAALGRTLLAVSMMSAQLKSSTDSVTAIISGGGPIGNITAVGHEGGVVKGCVTNPEVELPLNALGKLDVSSAVGRDGELRVIRDNSMGEPYVGRCRLVDGEIAEDFTQYFLISEQQPSLVYLGVRIEPQSGDVRAAAGMIIAPLPNCPEEDIAAIEGIAPQIATLSSVIDSGISLDSALEKLFSGMNFCITESLPAKFMCDCNRSRLESVLISLGREELTDMIEKDGKAELVCRFCNQKYHFSGDDLRKLLAEAQMPEDEL